MSPNPILGVLFHAIGGFAAGSFYAPLKRVRGWSWESYWLVMGIAAWLVTPWVVACTTTPELARTLTESAPSTLAAVYFFGVLWGVGGLTFGLTMRYLDIGLGMAVALGFCAIVGTIEPPIRHGNLVEKFSSLGGTYIAIGLALCVAGIAVCGFAGVRKGRELGATEKARDGSEFALGKGLVIATISGVLSACFAIGLDRGKPIAEMAAELGTSALYTNNSVLLVILMGGLTTNLLWCIALNTRNHSFSDYVSGTPRMLFVNYSLSIISGTIWYQQFFFYGMGQTKIGPHYEFSSWTLHMSFIIIFSNLWGIVLREWKGTTWRTQLLVWIGIALLITATGVIGYGNSLAPQYTPPIETE